MSGGGAVSGGGAESGGTLSLECLSRVGESESPLLLGYNREEQFTAEHCSGLFEALQ